MTDALPLPLRRTVAMVVVEARHCRDPWWLTAGAAAALHGVAVDVNDVDVVMSLADAHAFSRRHALAPATRPDRRFRSALIVTWTAAPLAVEVMAGFEAKVAGGWRSMTPRTREAVRIDGCTCYVPTRTDLCDMLRAWGRPKDLNRAAALT